MQNSDYAPAAKRRRRPKGQLYTRRLKSGSTSYGVRFMVDGKRHYRTIGSSLDGWTAKKARAEIDRLMALVFSGVWDPEDDYREPEPEKPGEFEAFALDWFEAKRRDGLTKNGEADLAWTLHHLIGWFGKRPLAEITYEEVDRFKRAKLDRPRGGASRADEPLSPTSVRKFVRVLKSILAVAVRYDRIAKNAADGIVVKPSKFVGTALDRAEAIVALLDAAGELDARGKLRRGHGRALLATLTFAGLRIDEALSLKWRDVKLADGYLRVGRAKTPAGVREVDLLAPLREELADLKALRNPEADAFVFGTSTGGKTSRSNVATRLLRRAAEQASVVLVERGSDPLPHLTPHSLRRTFASVGYSVGWDPLFVTHQLGHTDPAFSLREYGRFIRRKDGEPERLAALVRGEAVEVVPAVVEIGEAG